MGIKSPYICRACDARFSALTSFDEHRVGAFTNQHPHCGRSCLTADAMRAKEWTQVQGVWTNPVRSARAALALRPDAVSEQGGGRGWHMSGRKRDRRASRRAKARQRWPEDESAWNGGHPNQAKGARSQQRRRCRHGEA